MIITPILTDDSSPGLLFHSSELVRTLSCDQQGQTQHNSTAEMLFFLSHQYPTQLCFNYQPGNQTTLQGSPAHNEIPDVHN